VVAWVLHILELISAWDEVYEHFGGLYLRFETDLRPERLGDAFPSTTIERLRGLKSCYDPDNVFHDNFNIAPQALLG
jgi:FAD/FMN-containing dehydrogenase